MACGLTDSGGMGISITGLKMLLVMMDEWNYL
jgi:hypothetical protein